MTVCYVCLGGHAARMHARYKHAWLTWFLWCDRVVGQADRVQAEDRVHGPGGAEGAG